MGGISLDTGTFDDLEDGHQRRAALAAHREAPLGRLAVNLALDVEQRRPSRKPFPDHLPRERVVVAAPASCTCCSSQRLSKVGEDVTETLEVIPRRWKVIQTMREKFTCRDCEKLSQAPAPYHAVPRGWAGPNLLPTIIYEKYGQHQRLNRQSERYAREGVELSVSTLANQVGACAFTLRLRLVAFHRFAAPGSVRCAMSPSRSSHASTAAHAASHSPPAPAARSRRSSSTPRRPFTIGAT